MSPSTDGGLPRVTVEKEREAGVLQNSTDMCATSPKYQGSNQKLHFRVGMLEAQTGASYWLVFGGWDGPEEGVVSGGHWAILNTDSHTKKVLLGHSRKKSIGLGAKNKSCSSARLWELQGDGLVWDPYPTVLLVWLLKELWGRGKEGNTRSIRLMEVLVKVSRKTSMGRG